ncbi:TetR/AcrR family transcriptional regulator [Nocardioides speluncae]|uniref:TetR/AcrR family transcriptional regulator n=1 Tax=Nocardioides speluncae TaxID=2670337 RepID=UPI00137965F8|nr:TetR/AcrR family transcriptional regulator [Nocardioides speluncae]
MSTPNPDRRNERSRTAILEAAMELCQERGFPKTTMEGIAARAGVGKQTIYRWWPSKAAVILEALNEHVGDVTDFPSTGDVVADLTKQMSGVARLLVSDEFAPYTKGLLPAAQNDAELAAALLQSIIAPRAQACRERLALAQKEGQLRPDVDLDDVVELLYAPLYYRLFLHTRPISPKQVPGMLALAFDGVGVRDK